MWGVYVLIGILISQFVTFFIRELTHDEEAACYVGCGLVFFPIYFITKVMIILYHAYVDKVYITVFVKTPENFLCSRTVRIKPRWYNNYYHEGENNSYIEKFETSSSIHKYPNLRRMDERPLLTKEWIKTHLVKRS